MNCALPSRSSVGWLLSAVCLLLWSELSSLADTLVPFGAEWRYFIGTEDASSPRENWRKPAFPDQSWDMGPAPVGYGEPDIMTGIPSSQVGNWLSVFFRRAFVVAAPGRVSQLDLAVRVDDGFVVWINGVEVGRYNVPSGDLDFFANGLSAIEPSTITLALTNNVPGLLVAGSNVLAIQVFNANFTSSDLLFDAELSSASDATPPSVVEVSPSANATVRELGLISVIFSESVAGVHASDLLINGVAATSVKAISPREYTFTCPQPPVGRVQVAWAGGHGIGDLASPANPFGGGTWSYTLDPSVAPAGMVISEFMADNTAGIRDDDGDRSDWIELRNAGSEPVDLSGWSLTDDATALRKWTFPRWVVPANNGHLLVWASEKDRTNSSTPFHTNFKLGTTGEYLALVDPHTNIVSEFAPAYPPQQANVSYGRDRVDAQLVGYFTISTPGSPNSVSGSGFVAKPVFSLQGGTYTNDTITVSIAAGASEVRYTVDGSIPTQTSPLYTSPLNIEVTTVLQARAFAPGLLPSEVEMRVYTLLNTGFSEFGSNLPILIINTAGRGIQQDQRVRAFVTAFEPHQGRAQLRATPDFESAAQIEVRGQTSSGFPKQPYNLEINDLYGNDLEVPLLGLPAESDWVLHNPYSDKCLMNNFLAFELHRKMGHYAPRCRFVEVFVKTSRGRVAYPSDYRGVYVLMEKIKIDKNRVDIEPLTPAHNKEPEITGGYIIKKDKNSPGDMDFFTSGGGGFSGQHLKYHEPKPREITPAQSEWILQYINRFEQSLYASDWLRRTGTNHYSHYIDVDSFVDHHWIVEFTKQIDGYRLSNYMSKDRGGKLRMEPIWDWNLALGNADYLDGWNATGWYYPQLGDMEHIWLRRLICGTPNGYDKAGDPDFNQKIVDRWSVLRTNVLSAAQVLARIDEIAAYLDEAQARDFSRFPRLNNYVWPNPSFYIAPTYAQIIQAMKTWVNNRYNWIDAQILKAPQLSRSSGPVPTGARVTLTAPTGAILFTLDGTDPRLPGGTINPLAKTYSGQAVTLESNARLFARARNGSEWSGPAVATYVVATPPLVITEIMYNPAALSGDTNTGAFEFIELKNIGTAELSLSGFAIGGGVDYRFGSSSTVARLAPGAHVLVVKNRAAFLTRYPSSAALVAGEYAGSLNNAGDRLILTGPLQEPILDFRYENDWYRVTDGAGFALVVRNERAGLSSWNEPGNWRASALPGGSPGADDPTPTAIPPILVNEVLTRPGAGETDLIELYNPGLAAVNIGGWSMTDDFDLPRKYVFPPGTILNPTSYLLLDRATFFGAGTNGFALNAAGDAIYLFSASGTELTGYAHGFRFGAADTGVSFGRHLTSTGEERFVAQTRSTFGAANAGPRVGPMVINEIMFEPGSTGGENNTEHEFLELLNISGESISLTDPASRTNPWRLRGGADFDFPTGSSVPPMGYVVLVSFDPSNAALAAGFRTKYGIGGDVQLFGPYSGALSNSGERLSLLKPALIPSGANTNLAYVLVDEVAVSRRSSLAFRRERDWPFFRKNRCGKLWR
jgi:hypothetical protein